MGRSEKQAVPAKSEEKGCRFNGRPPVSKTGCGGSNPSTPASCSLKRRSYQGGWSRQAGIYERNKSGKYSDRPRAKTKRPRGRILVCLSCLAATGQDVSGGRARRDQASYLAQRSADSGHHSGRDPDRIFLWRLFWSFRLGVQRCDRMAAPTGKLAAAFGTGWRNIGTSSIRIPALSGR